MNTRVGQILRNGLPLAGLFGSAAVGAWAYNKYGYEDAPASQKLAAGAVAGMATGFMAAGVGAGLASVPGHQWERAAGALQNRAKSYWSRNITRFNDLKKHGTLTAFNKSFGGRGFYLGAGATAGALLGSAFSDDPVTGAVVGGAAGLLARGAWAGNRAYTFAGRAASRVLPSKLASVVGGAGKLGMTGFLAAGVATAGVALSGGSSMEAAGVVNEAGDLEYVDPSALKQRLRAMNADGNIVFGMHNRRH